MRRTLSCCLFYLSQVRYQIFPVTLVVSSRLTCFPLFSSTIAVRFLGYSPTHCCSRRFFHHTYRCFLPSSIRPSLFSVLVHSPNHRCSRPSFKPLLFSVFVYSPRTQATQVKGRSSRVLKLNGNSNIPPDILKANNQVKANCPGSSLSRWNHPFIPQLPLYSSLLR